MARLASRSLPRHVRGIAVEITGYQAVRPATEC
jgi:hypothetical protein